MKTLDEFVGLVRTELGLPLTDGDARRTFDELPGWDSVYLLTVLTLLERRTGKQVSLPAMLEAGSLEQIYTLAAAA